MPPIPGSGTNSGDDSSENLARLLAPGSDDESGSEVEYQDEILSSSEEESGPDGSDGSKSDYEKEFPTLDSEEESDGEVAEVAKPAVKRSGATFAAMGLSRLILTNIQRKGFKTPTPIQRKTVPLILDGKDVVGMARTGSGKTAAFVLPMLERLHAHSGRMGIRAIVLSPSRELAIQTLRTVKDLGRKTDLRTVLLVGGDSLEDQFGLMMSNPDIVVATPGRFVHIKAEMRLNLSTVEYVVFDEADRLFEMGFAEQLNDTLASLPDSRQTLLFSATLPPTLVEFAKAGLQNPELARLDADQKISEQLQMAYFAVKDQERDATLLYLLESVIKLPSMTEEQRKYLAQRENYDGEHKQKREKEASGTELPSERATLVFVPTKHHVEYVAHLLRAEGYAVSYIYGSLDQAARREQLYRFKAGKTSVMVVTDVAARGVDIPMLANVVNYNTPTAARVFIHRVGRTARAGHTGWAYTLVRQQDLPYIVDLEVFLGRPITTSGADYTQNLVLGAPPRSGIEFFQEQLDATLKREEDILELRKVAARGEKLWLKSREPASKDGVKKARELLVGGQRWEVPHPLTAGPNRVSDSNGNNSTVGSEDPEAAKNAFLARLANRPVKETVFEFRKTGASDAAQMMARRRQQIAPVQDRLRKKLAEREAELRTSTEQHRDEANYLSHFEPTQSLQDRGYAVNGTAGFSDAARRAGFSVGDEGCEIGATKQFTTRWDKKHGKYVNTSGENTTKYIRGENGQKIPASLRSGRFEAWKQAHKLPASTTGAMESAAPELRKFKHNKLQAPKRADKARDDYKERSHRVKEAMARHLRSNGDTPNSTSKRQSVSGGLRTSADIAKERAAKQKRWVKSNQPGKKNHKKH